MTASSSLRFPSKEGSALQTVIREFTLRHYHDVLPQARLTTYNYRAQAFELLVLVSLESRGSLLTVFSR
jgi:hypothetical protein